MESDYGSFCQAIKKVTYGIDGTHPSHVGVLYITKNDTIIIEADTHGVVLTPMDSFLNRSVNEIGKPKIFVGRLKEEYQGAVTPAIERMYALLGKSYDFAFDIDNDSYYCSELLYRTFLDINGLPLFELQPMTFNDPDTKAIFPIWKTYFENLGIPVPEGKPGLNPGSISRSDKIRIIYKYY